jgi:hypothetical protein
LKRTPIRKTSKKQRRRQADLQKLKEYLLVNRAEGRCEIPLCNSIFMLQLAHVISRGRCGKDNARNTLIACFLHHDHYKYSNALPLSEGEALELIEKLNQEHGIDPELTGGDL